MISAQADDVPVHRTSQRAVTGMFVAHAQQYDSPLKPYVYGGSRPSLRPMILWECEPPAPPPPSPPRRSRFRKRKPRPEPYNPYTNYRPWVDWGKYPAAHPRPTVYVPEPVTNMRPDPVPVTERPRSYGPVMPSTELSSDMLDLLEEL